MLQRIQSVFMFIAVISMLATLFVPLWEKAEQNEENIKQYAFMNVYSFKYEQHDTQTGSIETLGSQNIFYLSIAAVLAAGIMLFSIFQYKNRMLQVKLNALFSLIGSALVVGMVFNTMKGNQLFQPEIQGTFLLGFYLPIVALLNNFLANRFIRKDEQLVKSADRIR